MPSFYGEPQRDQPVEIEDFARRFFGDEFEWVHGRFLWAEWLMSLRWLDAPDGAITDLIELLATQIYPLLECPRVFISHRQSDEKQAMRVAWLAHKARFQFWIDVLDLKLTRGGVSVSEADKLKIVASLIELALLNCSHVLSLLTPNSRGSLWIPYEYGRVKRTRTGYTRRAAVWLSPKIDPKDDPEYTLLAIRTETETEILQWFGDELRAWRRVKHRCQNGSNDPWRGGAKPIELPRR